MVIFHAYTYVLFIHSVIIYVYCMCIASCHIHIASLRDTFGGDLAQIELQKKENRNGDSNEMSLKQFIQVSLYLYSLCYVVTMS